MKIEALEYDFKQRAYDGKWERLALVQDTENSRTYNTESGQEITLTPVKWITVGVTDLLGKWTD
jgi:hypothetical protein